MEYLQIFDQNLHFFMQKGFNFDQAYLNTGSKTQSLDLIFHNNLWLNIKLVNKTTI